jgi:AraC family transcriptional regulator, transcriptional activator of pobA
MEYVDIKSISELHEYMRLPPPVHPLITVIDFSKVDRSHRKPGVLYFRLAMYVASCKNTRGQFMYGRSAYDFSEGSLMFTAPHQPFAPDPEKPANEGWGLFIHPDFLAASERGQKLTTFSFFGYDTNEALHVSDPEKKTLEGCLQNIQKEIGLNLDQHSYNLVLSNLELFFAYCNPYYDRQFLTRMHVSNDAVNKFEQLLHAWFAQDSLNEAGLPPVKYFAEQLHLSPNYLSDLLNKYTGKTTQEHIHLKLTEKAKALLWGTERSVSQIAFSLGFEHPSHFAKLFKSRTGMSPTEFRSQN